MANQFNKIKKNGERCKNHKFKSSQYCFVHSVGRKKNVPFYMNILIQIAFFLATIIFTFYLNKKSETRIQCSIDSLGLFVDDKMTSPEKPYPYDSEIQNQVDCIDANKLTITALDSAIVAIARGKYEEAIIHLKYIKIFVNDDSIKFATNLRLSYCYIELGNILRNKGYVDSSFIFFNNAVEQSKEALKYRITLASAFNYSYSLFKAEEPQEALLNFKITLEFWPDHHMSNFFTGRILFIMDRLQESIKYFDKALELDSNYTEPWYFKALYLERKGKYYEAISLYKKAINSSIFRHLLWEHLTFCYIKTQQYYEALPWIDSLLYYNIDLINTYLTKIDILIELDSLPEALICCEKALTFNHNDVELLTKKSRILYLQQNFDATLNILDIILTLQPNNEDALILKCALLIEYEKFDQALAMSNIAISLIEDNYHAWSNKAIALLEL